MKRGLFSIVAGLSISAFALTAVAQENQPQTPPAAPTPAPAQPTTPAAPATGEAPKLVLSQNEWDFGTKWYGEKCESEVTIKNEGKAPLTIVNIRSSCGCTVAKPKSGGVWQNKVLQPGESDAMTLTYNTKKHAAKVSQTITIETNDPASPSLAFQVKGEVKNLFTFTPPEGRVTFPRIERDEKSEQKLTLESNLEEPINLKLGKFESEQFEVTLNTITEGKKYELIAKTKPPLKMGPNQANIQLETGMAQNPTIDIPISAFIQARVSVSPPRIMVSPKVNQPFTKNVRVNFKPDKPVNIVKVTPSTDKIKCEVMPPAPTAGPSVMAFREIKVTLPPTSELPAEGAKIEIETDDPAEEYKKLTVEVVIRETPARPVPPPGAPGAPTAPGSPTPSSPSTPGAKPAEGGVKPAEGGKPAEGAKPTEGAKP